MYENTQNTSGVIVILSAQKRPFSSIVLLLRNFAYKNSVKLPKINYRAAVSRKIDFDKFEVLFY
jgi:hypothetical protein